MFKRKPLVIFVSLLCLLLTISVFHKSILTETARYLSVSKPVDGEILIVEAWINHGAIIEAVEVFKRGAYKYLLVTGNRDYLPSAIQTIKHTGLQDEFIRISEIPNDSTGHNTFDMAYAAKNWLRTNDPSIEVFDVFTESVHGRKSWVVFRRVFGEEFEVGIKSSLYWHYGIEGWWKSRAGIRCYLKSYLGYVYALIWPFSLYT
ncbi:hypothetical protein CHISP_1703 [Chitinispirillum alkaliphilum]|nr:hypothetical protein CHISP_1703 [Chitinispirillum alkaliphilum]